MSNMAVHKWEDTESKHIIELSNNLRHNDRLEIKAYSCGTEDNVITNSVLLSSNAKTWTVDGQVALICGVVSSRLIGSATPWVLTTPIVEQYPYIFLKGSRYIVSEWKKQYPHLTNIVDARYETAIKWLKWVGFQVHDPIPVGKDKVMFHPIEMYS